MSIGPSRVEVPIRFRNADKQFLGGAKAILTCNAAGEVACNPKILNLGTMKAGVPLSIQLQLTSKKAAPILIDKIQSTYPWIQMKWSSQDSLFMLSGTAKPPPEMQEQGIAGYFQVQMRLPAPRSLRIFYFGLVGKRSFPRDRLPGSQTE
jgi:hypothetical protein